MSKKIDNKIVATFKKRFVEIFQNANKEPVYEVYPIQERKRPSNFEQPTNSYKRLHCSADNGASVMVDEVRGKIEIKLNYDKSKNLRNQIVNKILDLVNDTFLYNFESNSKKSKDNEVIKVSTIKEHERIENISLTATNKDLLREKLESWIKELPNFSNANIQLQGFVSMPSKFIRH